MAEGDEARWLPGCRAYRQKVSGDWEGAFAGLGHALGGEG